MFSGGNWVFCITYRRSPGWHSYSTDLTQQLRAAAQDLGHLHCDLVDVRGYVCDEALESYAGVYLLQGFITYLMYRLP